MGVERMTGEVGPPSGPENLSGGQTSNSTGATFDLTVIEQEMWSRNGRTRGFTLILVFAGGLGLLVVLSNPIPSIGSGRFFIVLGSLAFIIFAVGLGVVVIGARVFRRGPQSLTVLQSGVRLIYQDGTSEMLTWTDPKLSFTINDFRESTFSLRQRVPCDFSVGTLGLRQFSLSAEATDAIVRAARNSAAAVYTRRIKILDHFATYWQVCGPNRRPPNTRWARAG